MEPVQEGIMAEEIPQILADQNVIAPLVEVLLISLQEQDYYHQAKN